MKQFLAYVVMITLIVSTQSLWMPLLKAKPLEAVTFEQATTLVQYHLDKAEAATDRHDFTDACQALKDASFMLFLKHKKSDAFAYYINIRSATVCIPML